MGFLRRLRMVHGGTGPGRYDRRTGYRFGSGPSPGELRRACTIGDQVLVGIGSIILDGAGAPVTPDPHILSGSLVLGSPAKVVHELSPRERAGIKGLAEEHVRVAAYYLEHKINVYPPVRS